MKCTERGCGNGADGLGTKCQLHTMRMGRQTISDDVEPQEALQWAVRFLDYALMHPSNWSRKDNTKMVYCPYRKAWGDK